MADAAYWHAVEEIQAPLIDIGVLRVITLGSVDTGDLPILCWIEVCIKNWRTSPRLKLHTGSRYARMYIQWRGVHNFAKKRAKQRSKEKTDTLTNPNSSHNYKSTPVNRIVLEMLEGFPYRKKEMAFF